MGSVAERRFLVSGDGWRQSIQRAIRLKQGYVTDTGKVVVRVRITDEKRAQLTVKAVGVNLAPLAFDYDIPLEDGQAMLLLLQGNPVEKLRHHVKHEGTSWTVDLFEPPLVGLAIATVALDNSRQKFARPDWIGREITGDSRYLTPGLARRGVPG